MNNLVFLHGFLGSPEDWNGVIAHLPKQYQCNAIDLTKQLPDWNQDSIVIGYSMGGRIALQAHCQFPCAGLVLIGAHFGLPSAKQKENRKEEEACWKELLVHSKDDFLKKWYAQPLFAGNLRLIEKRANIDPIAQANLLSRYSLADQPLLKPPTNALFLYGERDEKYKNLYSPLPNAHSIPEAGHAAHLENPLAIAQIIERYVEKIYDAAATRNHLERS